MKKFLGLLAMLAFVLFAATASTSAASPGHTPEEVVYSDVGLSPPAFIADAMIYNTAEFIEATPYANSPTCATHSVAGPDEGCYEYDVGYSFYPADLNNSNYKIKSWLLMFQSKHPPGTSTTSTLQNRLATISERSNISCRSNPSLYRCDRARYV